MTSSGKSDFRILGIITIAVLFCFTSFSQIKYEKGYFIDESGQKTECFIKNRQWLNNPTKIEYKLNQDANSESITIQTLKEFGIYGVVKYVRATVLMDRTGDQGTKLTFYKDPVFEKETIFLNTLIEGKASLYEYIDGSLTRFFYHQQDSAIKQLVKKTYYVGSRGTIAHNNLYKQQLYTGVNCNLKDIFDLEDLRYNRKDLVEFFKAYNFCSGEDILNFNPKRYDYFNLTLRPGYNLNRLDISNIITTSLNTEFKNEFTFRIGIEAEFVLPFNQSRWAIIFEPTYQKYTSEQSVKKVVNYADVELITKASIPSIEVPFGLRHAFYLSDKSKIYLNCTYLLVFNQNAIIDFERPDLSSYEKSLVPGEVGNFIFGLGYKYNNKFSVEVQQYANRNILATYTHWHSKYQVNSIIFGYTLF